MAPPPPPPPPSPEPAPTLPDELLEDIFLRLPPGEPECLVRASATSKPWRGRLTAPRFHARYSDFHGAAPMLGFFQSGPNFVLDEHPLFVSTTKFPARIPNPGNSGYHIYEVWDCRHGRLLLGGWDVPPKKLVVLDPVTGCRRKLDVPPGYYHCSVGAVLCAVNSCDHGACHDSPSRVVFVGLDIDNFVVSAHESLVQTGRRNKPQSHLRRCSVLHVRRNVEIQLVPPILIQDTLYFKLVNNDDEHMAVGILKYDLRSKCLSLIDVPPAAACQNTIIMGMEDGSLGFAHLDGLTLNLWSRQMGSDGAGSWSQYKVIDLWELLRVPNKKLKLIGSVEGGDIIFVTTVRGTYGINLKSLEWKNIWKEHTFRSLIPYVRFCYPQGRAKLCDAAD